ncbi:MAG: hypothetical protein ACKVU1_14730 [bacterium]
MKARIVTGIVAASCLLVGCFGIIGPSGGSNKSPATPEPQVRGLYLSGVDAPRVVRANDPIILGVQGNLPNPGWKFLKWDVRVEERDGTTVTIVKPLIVYTLGAGEAVPQVLVPFEGEARIDAAGAVGVRTIEVRGSSAEETIRREVEVVANGAFLDLEITGGIAGIRTRVTVASDGAIFAQRSMDGRNATGQLGANEMSAIRAARDAARLNELEPSYITENAADLFFYDLVDLSGERATRVIADDLAMPEGFRSLVTELQRRAEALFEN